MKTIYRAIPIKHRRWVKRLFLVIILLFLFFLFSGVRVWYQTRKPLQVSDRFVEYVLDKDIEAAYELTSEPFRQSDKGTNFEAVVDELSSNLSGPVQRTKDEARRTAGGALVSTVEYASQADDTEAGKITVVLIEDNNSWRVLNVNRGE